MKAKDNSSILVHRIAATIIDYFIIFTLMLLFSLVYLVLSGALGFEVKHIELIMLIFLWFTLLVLPEYKFGVTIGKKFTGIKTISTIDRKKPTFVQVLKRRIFDPVDIFILGVVSIIIMINSEEKQRFGDKFAQTNVVDKKKP